MTSIFISYSRSNRQFANCLHFELSRAGFDPWIDVQDIRFSEKWFDRLEQEIKNCDYFILLLPKTQQISDPILQEYEWAKSYLGNEKICVVKLTDDELPKDIAEIHLQELKNGYEQTVKNVLRWLGMENDQPPTMVELLQAGVPAEQIETFIPYDERRMAGLRVLQPLSEYPVPCGTGGDEPNSTCIYNNSADT